MIILLQFLIPRALPCKDSHWQSWKLCAFSCLMVLIQINNTVGLNIKRANCFDTKHHPGTRPRADWSIQQCHVKDALWGARNSLVISFQNNYWIGRWFPNCQVGAKYLAEMFLLPLRRHQEFPQQSLQCCYLVLGIPSFVHPSCCLLACAGAAVFLCRPSGSTLILPSSLYVPSWLCSSSRKRGSSIGTLVF